MKHLTDTIREALEFFECGSYSTSKALTAITAFAQLEAMVGEQEQSLAFYKRRCDALQQWQSKMRDPERTIVCDILANGCTLEPAGDRYATPPAQQSQAEDGLNKLRDMLQEAVDRLTAAPQQPQYEAGDMASAHNDGFRAGVASVAQQPQEPEMTPAFRSSNAYTVGFQDGKAQALAQQPQAVPPANCRQRLKHDGKAYPRSSCAACGEFSPKWKECDAAMAQGEKP